MLPFPRSSGRNVQQLFLRMLNQVWWMLSAESVLQDSFVTGSTYATCVAIIAQPDACSPRVCSHGMAVPTSFRPANRETPSMRISKVLSPHTVHCFEDLLLERFSIQQLYDVCISHA